MRDRGVVALAWAACVCPRIIAPRKMAGVNVVESRAHIALKRHRTQLWRCPTRQFSVVITPVPLNRSTSIRCKGMHREQSRTGPRAEHTSKGPVHALAHQASAQEAAVATGACTRNAPPTETRCSLWHYPLQRELVRGARVAHAASERATTLWRPLSSPRHAPLCRPLFHTTSRQHACSCWRYTQHWTGKHTRAHLQTHAGTFADLHAGSAGFCTPGQRVDSLQWAAWMQATCVRATWV